MIFRSLAGCAVFAATTAICLGTAAAADLPLVKAPPVAPVAYAPGAIYSWTGFYIGGQAGAGFGRSSWSDPFNGTNNAFNSGAGFLGGGQIGANYQLEQARARRRGRFQLDGTACQRNRLDRRHHRHEHELDVDRHRAESVPRSIAC